MTYLNHSFSVARSQKFLVEIFSFFQLVLANKVKSIIYFMQSYYLVDIMITHNTGAHVDNLLVVSLGNWQTAFSRRMSTT